MFDFASETSKYWGKEEVARGGRLNTRSMGQSAYMRTFLEVKDEAAVASTTWSGRRICMLEANHST